MDRCHLYLPLVDSSGVPYSYAEVTLLDAEDGTPVADPVYLTPSGGAPQQWPILTTPAVINLWTDTPMRVTVQALLPGGAVFTRSGVDISPAPAATVRSERPVRIGSAEGLGGDALLAVSPTGDAKWQVLDALRFHSHEGNAPESTVLGPLNPNDIYPGQTFLGSATPGAQGEGATALGRNATPNGPGAVVAGEDATAADDAVAAGAGSVAGGSSVAFGVQADAIGSEQVALGRDSSAELAPNGAVVLGAQTAAADGDMVTVNAGIRLAEDGTVIVGEGAVPDLSWLDSPSVVFLDNAVFPNFFAPRQDTVLGGASSTVGVFGQTGTTQPMLSTGDLDPEEPGREALLSLLAALDELGLVYLLDGAIDDELADWDKTFAHDANMGLETGDGDGSKDGDTDRTKREDVGPGTITYQQTTGVRDFALRAFVWWQDWNPANHVNEITAHVSPDNTTWTPVPLAWEPLTPTTADWNYTWARNARPIPYGMQYLRITVDLNSEAWTPQIGRVIVRRRSLPEEGFGGGGFGDGPFGG